MGMLPAGQRRQPKARLPVAIQAGCIPTPFPANLSLHPLAHSQLSPEEQQTTGVTDDYVRLSIGIEHIDDILADLDQALKAAA